MPPAPTVATGIRSSAVGIVADRRVVEMRDKIFAYDPDKTPFLTPLSMRAPSVLTRSPNFKHLEDQPLPWWDTLSQILSSATQTTGAATGFLPTNISFFRPGDIVLIPSSSQTGGEYLKVTAVAAGAGFVVVRGYANDGVNGGTAASGAFCAIIGNVNEENATVRQIKSTTEVAAENYTQIIRTPVGASETLSGTLLYGGSERDYDRRKAAVQHAFEIERTFLFGKKRETTGPNGHRERATGGLLSWITTNVTNVGGALTDSVFETFAETLFRYGSSTKLLLASRRVMSQMDMIAAGRLQTVPRADTYGVAMKRYVTGHGELMVAISDFLINDYAGYAIAIDLENVAKRYMKDSEGRDRDSQLRTNIEDPSADGWIDEYLSEVGLHVTLESAHGVLKGVS